MIAIDIVQAKLAEASIAEGGRKLRRFLEETKETCHRLQNISGMEQVLRNTGNCIEELEDEISAISQLDSCLQNMIAMYSEREMIICGYLEEMQWEKQKVQIGIWEVPEWIYAVFR